MNMQLFENKLEEKMKMFSILSTLYKFCWIGNLLSVNGEMKLKPKMELINNRYVATR